MAFVDKYTNIAELPLVAVGGVGGSGTRLIAEMLQKLGVYIGSTLTEQNDNLWFTLLFKRSEILSASNKDFDELLEIFIRAMNGNFNFSNKQSSLVIQLAKDDRPPLTAARLRRWADTLILPRRPAVVSKIWGWKEPNTHILIDRLHAALPEMKYIHVVRNGLDMAYSGNQNQLRFWGGYALPECRAINPRCSLKYWCHTHKHMRVVSKIMGDKFLMLDYDRLCAAPEQSLTELIDFLSIKQSAQEIKSLCKMVNTPSSMGRFKWYSACDFDSEDIEFVRDMGFDVSY